MHGYTFENELLRKYFQIMTPSKQGKN